MTLRFLLVDDFEPFRKFVRSVVLDEVGFPEITETADGRSAVYLAEKLQPDLIVLDINLPDINGIDAAKKIRQVSPSSRIIFASLDNDADIRAAALEADPQAYVLKMNAGRELPKDIRAALDAI